MSLLPFVYLSHILTTFFGFYYLRVFLHIIFKTNYFRVYQKWLFAAMSVILSQLAIVVLVFTGAKMLMIWWKVPEVFLMTLELYKATLNIFLEFAQLFLAADIYLFTKIPYLHHMLHYGIGIGAACVFGIFFSLFPSFLEVHGLAWLTKVLELAIGAGIFMMFKHFYKSSALLVEAWKSYPENTFANQIPTWELKHTSYCMMVFSGLRLASKLIQLIILFFSTSPIAFLISEHLSLLEPILFVFILFHHDQSTYLYKRSEVQAARERLGDAFPKNIIIGYPCMTLRHQENKKLMIWRKEKQHKRELIYAEPIAWEKLDQVPFRKEPKVLFKEDWFLRPRYNVHYNHTMQNKPGTK